MKKTKIKTDEDNLKDLFKQVNSLKEKEEVKQKSNIFERIKDNRQFKNLMQKHKEYLDILKIKKAQHYEKLKIDDKLKAVKIEEKIQSLKQVSEIKVNEFLSDNKFIKNVDKLKWYNWIKKLKRKIKKHVLVVIHRPDNHDLARFFPLEKGHIVDIDNHKHLFNPKHFRYINGQAVIYFYWGNPFAKVINVEDGYTEPTISSEAFSSVLTSKFVIDAVKGEEAKIGLLWSIIIIILIVIVMIVGFLNLVGLNNLQKALGQ